MSELKATPGPWEVGDVDRNGQRQVRSEHTEVATCWHHCLGSLLKEMEANAHLIAAAPDLYAVAEMLVFICDSGNIEHARLALMDNSPLVGEARLALRKARGEA